MKTTPAILLLLASAFIVSCQNRTTDDPEKMKKVLTDYFDGIKNKDHNKMKSVTTDDFTVYEDGDVWSNDSVFKEMDRISPYTAEFKFENFNINIDSKLAHMNYNEHAEFTVRDTVKFNLYFIGSAALTKIDGTWKMYFMHATKRHAPKQKVTKLIQKQ